MSIVCKEPVAGCGLSLLRLRLLIESKPVQPSPIHPYMAFYSHYHT